MVEVLIGLALAAILFTALTSAIAAGTKSAQSNVDYFTTVQRARVVLQKLSSDVRDCYDVDLESPTTGTNPLTGAALDVRASPTVNPVAYRWVSATNKLCYYTDAWATSGAGALAHPLASNVTSLTFQAYTKTVNSTLILTNVNITMTIAFGADSITLCESVTPRRSMTAR